jgi:hypothetical protein
MCMPLQVQWGGPTEEVSRIDLQPATDLPEYIKIRQNVRFRPEAEWVNRLSSPCRIAADNAGDEIRTEPNVRIVRHGGYVRRIAGNVPFSYTSRVTSTTLGSASPLNWKH